jgi:hypothetical protein
MSKSRLHVLGWGLVAAAAFCALFLASLGAGEARAGDCDPNTTTPNTFQLGVWNECNSSPGTTYLIHQGPGGVGPSGLLFLANPDDAPALTARAKTAVVAQTLGTNGMFGVSGLLGSNSTLEELAALPGSAAIYGVSASINENGPGVWGLHWHGRGSAPGVLGTTNSGAANTAGVRGMINTSAPNAAGVRGDNASASCCGMGVAGFHAGQGIGVYGEAPIGFGVSGYSPFNWSGYFQGSVNVVGTLFKSSGAFRIDNPLDPAHSYLQHSFVESPDMKNIYDGNVTTNAKGFATVKLPAYFQALNKDFRYQLTVVGKAHWDAKAAIWQEVKNNRFTIRTDQRNVTVSWLVTGIRKDAWANAHRIQTVVPKTGSADNKYVHPELYGKPLTKSVVVLPGMKLGTQPKFNAPTLPKQK